MEDYVFKEHHNTNGYSSFESKRHPGWFLALTNEGRAKPGPKTASGQRAVEFLSGNVYSVNIFPLNIQFLSHFIMLIA